MTRRHADAIQLVSRHEPVGNRTSIRGLMRRRYALRLTACLVAVIPAVVQAQTTQPARTFVSINVGAQVTSTTFDDNVVFTEFVEQGDFNAIYRVPTGSLLDVDGGVRLPMNFGVAIGATRFYQKSTAEVDARIPHPFYFSRDRSIVGDTASLDRRETAVHLSARWFLPTADSVELSGFGGPTFFSLAQELITGVEFDHSYPFNSATFTSTAESQESQTVVGYHVGADMGYFFSPNIGVGTLIRFSRASTALLSEDGDSVAVNVGGLNVTGGLRLRF